MTLRKLLKLMCPTACAVCLAAGYAVAGTWIALALVALVWVAWLFTADWPPSVLLAASVGLAAGGLVVGASPVLMITAGSLALASWDVVRWDGFLAGHVSVEIETRLERKHYTSLALAVGAGLLAAIAGRLLHFPLPFVGLVAVVLLAFLGLDRIWRLVEN
jgi:hypothetical protein